MSTDRDMTALAAARSDVADAAAEAPPLPKYPDGGRLFWRLIYLSMWALVLNFSLAAIAIVINDDSKIAAQVWSFLEIDDPANRSLLSVFVMLVLAQFFTTYYPNHLIHDEAVNFFHTAELCRRLAREITAYVFPGTADDRRAWAYNVMRIYKGERWWTKFRLVFVAAAIFVSIMGPWSLVPFQVGPWWYIAILVGALMGPVAVGIVRELSELISPAKHSPLFLDSES